MSLKQVKATSNAFKNSISGVKGGEPLMTLAGWKTEVGSKAGAYAAFYLFSDHSAVLYIEAKDIQTQGLATYLVVQTAHTLQPCSLH